MSKASATKTAKSEPGHLFLKRLGPGSEHYLKRIASALYNATGKRKGQDALLTFLRNGDIIASVHWPSGEDLIDLPPAIWQEVAVRDFKVRSHLNGDWKNKDFSLPAALLLKHLGVQHLRAIIAESLVIDEGATGTAGSASTSGASARKLSVSEKRLHQAIRLLDTGRRDAEVVITMANAKVFVDTCLGPLTQVERRGRNRTYDGEFLMLEMFRRLHLMPELPSQKDFVTKMTNWWNSNPDPDLPTRGKDWVEKYAKRVWAVLKAAPKP